MDYELMLNYNKAKKADITMAAMPVPIEEASRFGVLVTEPSTGKIIDFQEEPKEPKSNLASMGIYIFNWKVLREALITNKDVHSLDFGMHVIPYCHQRGDAVYCYEYNSYWKDVGTLSSYWEANMELIDLVPVFNLYEEYWQIYTNSISAAPQFIDRNAFVERCIIAEGAEIYGRVTNSVIGANVIIEEGAVVNDSIIMESTVIGKNTRIEKAIIAEDCRIGDGCVLGDGEYRESTYNPKVYNADLVTIGENSVIPDGVRIGKNTAILGVTTPEDYPDGRLESGGAIVKGGM
jgi:glucose-1-phosphate adenylyltransferase